MSILFYQNFVIRSVLMIESLSTLACCNLRKYFVVRMHGALSCCLTCIHVWSDVVSGLASQEILVAIFGEASVMCGKVGLLNLLLVKCGYLLVFQYVVCVKLVQYECTSLVCALC